MHTKKTKNDPSCSKRGKSRPRRGMSSSRPRRSTSRRRGY